MFSDALDREAAWLSSSGDGLPALLKGDGGPFDHIQARMPRSPATRKRAIYVCRAPGQSARLRRFAAPSSILTTRFHLKLWWPMSNGSGSAESEQVAFEQAIDHLLTRIEGPLMDKTHGGRFLSVAESPEYIDIDIDDPASSIKASLPFTGRITYSGDDPDFAN